MKVNDRLSKLSAGEVPQFGQICKVIQAYVGRIFEALAKSLSTNSLEFFYDNLLKGIGGVEYNFIWMMLYQIIFGMIS